MIKSNNKGGTFAASKRKISTVAKVSEHSQSPETLRMPKRKKKNPFGIIIAAVIVAIIFLGMATTAIYVDRLETIFPNVSFAGVNVGGMSITEAGDALEASGYGDGNNSVSVELPLEHILTLTVKEAVKSATPIEAAAELFAYGRDGNALQNLITYLRCLAGGYSPEPGSIMKVDGEYVARVVTEEVQKVNTDLMGSGLEIGQTEITVIKGAKSIVIDENAIYTLVMNALDSGDYGTLVYTPQNTGVEDLDLQSIYDTVYKEAKNAEYDPATQAATEHVTGVSFDVTAAQALWNSASTGQKVAIPLIITEPEITTQYLNSRLFSDVLSEKTTSLYGSSNARINNVKKACQAINGMVMNPGDEFSYNTVVGKRTLEAGYQSAGAYSGGEVVSEVGGGICQVSSTIYYCALYSNLQITSRTCHYFPVSYLPAGLDATVSWGGPEFKFVNNRDYPIKISASVEGNTCNVKIVGTDVDGSYVKITTDSWVNADESTGVTSYRSVYDAAGNLLSKTKESSSRYYVHKTEESPKPSESPTVTQSPEVSPTPPVTPTPTNSPTPTVSPTPEVSATPEVTPSSPQISSTPVITDTPAATETGTTEPTV